MEGKVKVLYFVDRMLRGGIQTFVIENLRHMDKTNLQVDFLLLDDGKVYELEEELRMLGSTVYKLEGIWIRKPWDFVKYCKALDDFFREHHDYKVVHMHSSSKNFMVLKYAKKYGIEIRIAHSHCIDFQTNSKIKKVVGDCFKYPLKKYATNYFACSKEAGVWLFGKKIVNSNRFMIVHNAVDLEKYKFNVEVRERIRNDLKIDKNTIVIGHVGRFVELKNHDFLVDVFYEFYEIHPNSKLLLIGTGIKENEIKEKVKRLGIEENVIFAGFRENVNDYMCAMDLFVLPSKTEGLGLVLIEAQASGLKCFTSKDVVPNEVDVSKTTQFLSLNLLPKEWADVLIETNIERVKNEDMIKQAGYDIIDTSKVLQDFYTKNNND